MHKPTKPPAKQREMFSKYQSMGILELFKELGRIRRQNYAKQMAYERSVEGKNGVPVNTAKNEGKEDTKAGQVPLFSANGERIL